jgi:hypothetical protein
MSTDLGARRGRRFRGFSLLEVMISASILIVGITSLVMAAHVATNQHAHHRKMSQALLIAERRMEALLMLFPSSLSLADGRHPGGGFEFFADDGSPLPDNTNAIYRLFYECVPRGIGESAGEPLIGLNITLTVAWDENGGERTVVLRTAR